MIRQDKESGAPAPAKAKAGASQDAARVDKRWRLVDSTIRRHGSQPHALIEALHTVQSAFGYIDEESMKYVARALRVPLSKVYGVATFYHFFKLKPQGKHACVICMGTACYIKGAPDMLRAIEEMYGVTPGETTEDGELSVMTARCIGSCGLAPAAVLDGDVIGRVATDELVDKIEGAIGNDA